MSSPDEVSPSQSPIRGYYYKLDKLGRDLAEATAEAKEKTDEINPFYIPALDLVQVVHSIPYELEKTAALSFDLVTKNRIVLQPYSTTLVPTKTILSSHPQNWELKIHQSELAQYLYKKVRVVRGSLPYLYKGNVQVKLKNITSEDIRLPENYDIARLFCRKFRY